MLSEFGEEGCQGELGRASGMCSLRMSDFRLDIPWSEQMEIDQGENTYASAKLWIDFLIFWPWILSLVSRCGCVSSRDGVSIVSSEAPSASSLRLSIYIV